MNLLIIFSFVVSNIEFIENKGILFEWESKENTLKGIELFYSPDGKNYYEIMVKKYSFPKAGIKDTFLWVFKDATTEIFNKIKGKAKIKIVYLLKDNKRVEEIKSFKEIKSSSLLIKDRYENKVKEIFNSSFEYGRYPSWPMFQVNPQHTGEYNYSVYPPLKYQWSYRLDYNDFSMMSASISSNGVIYVGDGGRFLRGVDIKTGKILWEEGLTANVWTSAVVNDTLVLAGTCISFDTAAPTLFLIDARTGNIVWGRHFPGLFTVEFQPIVVDTLIYVTTLTRNKLFCSTLNGNLVWSFITDSTETPAGGGIAWDNKNVFIGADCKIYSFCDKTGEIIWTFLTNNWIDVVFPLSINGLVYFFADSTLFAIHQNSGDIYWKKGGFLIGSHPTPSYKNHKVFHRWGRIYDSWIVCRKNSGEEIWVTDVEDTVIKHIVLTSNDLLFTMGERHIYILDPKNGTILYKIKFPGPHEGWLTPWFWPLIYGPYVIITHWKNMYVYKGVELKLPTDEEDFIFYPTLVKNQGYLFFNILSSKEVKLKVFDISGKVREIINLGKLEKGSHFYVWIPKNISGGVYFIKWKEEKKKFIYVK